LKEVTPSRQNILMKFLPLWKSIFRFEILKHLENIQNVR
jgi:hypothetical protein